MWTIGGKVKLDRKQKNRENIRAVENRDLFLRCGGFVAQIDDGGG